MPDFELGEVPEGVIVGGDVSSRAPAKPTERLVFSGSTDEVSTTQIFDSLSRSSITTAVMKAAEDIDSEVITTPSFWKQRDSHGCGWFCIFAIRSFLDGRVLGPEDIPTHSDVHALLALVKDVDYVETGDKERLATLSTSISTGNPQTRPDFTYPQRLTNHLALVLIKTFTRIYGVTIKFQPTATFDFRAYLCQRCRVHPVCILFDGDHFASLITLTDKVATAKVSEYSQAVKEINFGIKKMKQTNLKWISESVSCITGASIRASFRMYTRLFSSESYANLLSEGSGAEGHTAQEWEVEGDAEEKGGWDAEVEELHRAFEDFLREEEDEDDRV